MLQSLLFFFFEYNSAFLRAIIWAYLEKAQSHSPPLIGCGVYRPGRLYSAIILKISKAGRHPIVPGYFTGMITRTAKRGVTTDEVIHRIKMVKTCLFLHGVYVAGYNRYIIDYSRGHSPEKFFIRRMVLSCQKSRKSKQQWQQ